MYIRRKIWSLLLKRWVAGVQVIDAEMARRKLLEETPIDSLREDPVQFDTAEVPWWAWVRRFHLPEVLSRLAPLPFPKSHSTSSPTSLSRRFTHQQGLHVRPQPPHLPLPCDSLSCAQMGPNVETFCGTHCIKGMESGMRLDAKSLSAG